MNDYFRRKNGMKVLQHIYLMGFMGSGKSFLGNKISKQLNIPFYDLDQEIEIFYKDSIQNIFKNKGEEFFRELESKVLKLLSANPPGVVSLGGGTPCFQNNISYLNGNGLTIFIETSIELICSRLQSDRNKRPLIEGLKENSKKLEAFVKLKLSERNPYYNQAKITIKQTHENQATIVKVIIEKIKSIDN